MANHKFNTSVVLKQSHFIWEHNLKIAERKDDTNSYDFYQCQY
ncbi:MAG TPA: hypothetical protein VK159_12870 [Lacibacter sp.]|nr:hypothetical protein [Lacibacter sp.]